MSAPSLAHRATRGVAWTVASGLIARGVGLVGTLIVTRFLAPDVVGEVTTATVLAFSASWITQLGFNQYVLVRGETREALFHATFASLVLAATALSVMALTGPHLANWFNAPKLHEYLPGMALAVFIRRIGSTPDKLLLRSMRFRTVAIASACGELAYAATAVSLIALFDFGGHGIVIGNIVQSVVIVGITIGACGVRDWLVPTRLHWQRFKEVLSFGAPLGLETMLYEFARYGDKLVYTRLFGPARTGEYSLAANLADLPAVYVGEQVSNVLLPTMLQVEGARRQGILARAIGMLAMLTFPMAIGLAAIAHTLVDVLLPSRWQGVAPFLVVLASVSLFRPINSLISQYLISMERNRMLLGLEMLRVATLFAALLLLGQIGPLAAAFAVGMAAFAHCCGLLYAIHGDGAFLRTMLAGLRAPVLSCIAIVVAVLTVRTAFGPVEGYGEAVLLVTETAAGACAYVGGMFLFGRTAVREALALASGALRPKRA